MNNVLKYLLILVLSFNSLTLSYAQSTNESQTRRMTKEEILAREQMLRAKVNYQIQRLSNIEMASDILNGELQRKASFGLTAEFVQDIEVVFKDTVQLMAEIYENEEMNSTEDGKKERRAMLVELYKAVGKLVLQVAHDETDDFDFEQFSKDLENYKKYVADKQTAIREATTTGRMTFREFGRDFIRYFTFKKTTFLNATGQTERVYAPIDAVRRDDLSEALIIRLQQFARETMPKLPAERGTRQFTIETFGETHPDDAKDKLFTVTDNMIHREGLRYKAQQITAATYLGMAVFGFFFPLVDWVGLAELATNGSRVDGSATMSAFSYFALWLSVGLVKVKSIDANLVNQLQLLKALTVNPHATLADVKTSRSGFGALLGRAGDSLNKATSAVSTRAKSCVAVLMNKISPAK